MKTFCAALVTGVHLIAVPITGSALTFPVAEDTSTSLDRVIARTAGKAATMPVSGTRDGLIRFDITTVDSSIRSTDVSSARLIIYFSKVIRPGGITVHRVTQNWSERYTEGQANVPNFEATPLATIGVPDGLGKQFVIIDVTNTVRGWLDDRASDFGFALLSQRGHASVLIGTKEGPAVGFPATLEIETAQGAAGTVDSTNLAPNLNLAGVTTGTFSGTLSGTASNANKVGEMSADDVATGVTLAKDSTDVNSSGSIVRRDSNGGFTAGKITATFSGDGSGLSNVTASNGIAATSLANINSAFMEFVRVGNPGNPNDSVDGDANTPGVQRLGAVGETFLIGKYEVTNDQYTRFLNCVAAADPHELYNPLMESDARGGILRSGEPGGYTYAVKTNFGNKPAIYIRFYDALRFCNWLHNGMPKGPPDATTTEDGAYLMIDEVYPDTVITRKAGAKAFLPTENQWYKAAYYDPLKGGTGGYYLFPTRSDTAPNVATTDAMGNIDNPSSNVANYASGGTWEGQTGNLTTVGSGGIGSESAYGAADMGGNVFEWNETPRPDTVRGLRGGSWASWAAQPSDLHSSGRYGGDPTAAQDNIGFRIAKP